MRTDPTHRRARPKLEALESRLVPYALSGYSWGNPSLLTASFMPDGSPVDTGQASTLFQYMNARYSTPTWEYQYAKALQTWADVTPLNFKIVTDPGQIRVGASARSDGYLAYTYYPAGGSLSGDSFWNTNDGFSIGTTYDIYSVALHEFGHSLGMAHSSVAGAVMDPVYSLWSGLSADDIAGIQAIYGARKPDSFDAVAPNDTFATASAVGLNSTGGAAFKADLSSMTDVDYFRFTAPSKSFNGNLTVTLDAGDYSLLIPSLTVYDVSGNALQTASATTYGQTLTVSLSGLVAGQNYVVNVSGATSDVFKMGAYQLGVQFGGASAPAVPPAAPTGLAATAGNAQVALTWTAVSGATSYDVYRSTTSGGEGGTPYRTGLTAAAYTDTGATNGTTYYYQVTALNTGGESTKSAEVSAMPQASAGGSASFVKLDAATQGSWQGVYGADGYNVVAAGASSPAYAAVTPAGQSAWTWAGSTADVRALQDPPGATGRLAATWYAGSSFTVDVNVTDGQTHQVALYLLDWDQAGRSERVDVLDAATGAVLASQTASGFAGGEYLVFTVGGHVTLKFTDLAGPNAVLSGLFFGAASAPPPAGSGSGGSSASFVKADVTTQGTWQGVYGADGYNVVAAGASYPAYAAVAPSGQSAWTWAGSTADVRALQDPPGATGRLAACWYAGSSFTVDVNVTDGKTHQLALYLLDWDKAGRSERVDVLDAASGAVLATQTASGFSGGEYLDFTVGGHVTLKFTDLAGPNAVLSGLFFGAAPAGNSASFVKLDTATQGSWQGVYGTDGYNVIAAGASSPAFAQVTPAGQSSWTWAGSTADVRALQDPPGAAGRVAACWYAGSSFTVDVNVTDGKTHTLALYLLDWDQAGRSERVDVLDAASGAVLATQTATSFSGGEYLVFTVGGHVTLKFTDLAGPNAVLSGLFFGTPGGALSTGNVGDGFDAGHGKGPKVEPNDPPAVAPGSAGQAPVYSEGTWGTSPSPSLALSGSPGIAALIGGSAAASGEAVVVQVSPARADPEAVLPSQFLGRHDAATVRKLSRRASPSLTGGLESALLDEPDATTLA